MQYHSRAVALHYCLLLYSEGWGKSLLIPRSPAQHQQAAATGSGLGPPRATRKTAFRPSVPDAQYIVYCTDSVLYSYSVVRIMHAIIRTSGAHCHPYTVLYARTQCPSMCVYVSILVVYCTVHNTPWSGRIRANIIIRCKLCQCWRGRKRGERKIK